MEDIVVSGYAGAEGVSEILKKDIEYWKAIYRESYIDALLEKYNSYKNPESDIYKGLDIVHSYQGGILKTLYEIPRQRKLGIRINIKSIPIMQSTVDICEHYELNPYRLLSDCIVIITDNGQQLVDKLHSEGIIAARVGELTKAVDKIIVDKYDIEHINRPTKDELTKLIPDYVFNKRN